jgi:CheY-specific phosphatase CheX
MSDQNFEQLVSETVNGVLETMFFSSPLGPAEPESGAAVLAARLAFHGNPSGTLEVCLSEASARLLAAGFLGEDDETLTDSQPGEVVCELANMLCGSLVSKLETDESFDLTSPELVPAGGEPATDSEAPPIARQSFEVENGILTVTLHLKAAA